MRLFFLIFVSRFIDSFIHDCRYVGAINPVKKKKERKKERKDDAVDVGEKSFVE